jgi:hypothetical protein
MTLINSYKIYRKNKRSSKFTKWSKRIFWIVVILIITVIIWFASMLKIFSEFDDRLVLIENKIEVLSERPCDKKEVIKKVSRSVVRVVGGEAEGSGFVINREGLVLTNFHVIEFEPSPKIIFPDNTFETGEIVMADKNSDLAVIKIKKRLPAIPFGFSNFLRPGDDLIAIGFALGGGLPGEVSVSIGSLAARRYFKEEDMNYLQMDSTLVSGLSGGPMVTACGEVVGINTAALTGMGFAISTETIREKYAKMKDLDDPLKDIKKITFEPNRSPLDAVSSFYNYLKIRKLEKAFELLSDNFKQGYGFELWKIGYESLLDTSVVEIKSDEKEDNIIYVKLTTKDFVDDEIIYRYFKGQWEVRQIDGKWLLWDPNIKEVEDYWELIFDE